MKKQMMMLAMTCVGTFVSTHCLADQEAEKRYLISIVTELENIKALAEKAETTRDDDDRLVFDYASLERDLVLMRAAIKQHIELPSRHPRRIGALAENYTEQMQDE